MKEASAGKPQEATTEKALTPETFRSLYTHADRITQMVRSPIDSSDDVPGLLTEAESKGLLNPPGDYPDDDSHDPRRVIYGFQAMAYLDKQNPRTASSDLTTDKTLKFSAFKEESRDLTNEHPDGSHSMGSVDLFITPHTDDAKCQVEYVLTTKEEVLFESTYFPYVEGQGLNQEVATQLDQLGIPADKNAIYEGGPGTAYTLSKGKLDENQGTALLNQVQDIRQEDLDGW